MKYTKVLAFDYTKRSLTLITIKKIQCFESWKFIVRDHSITRFGNVEDSAFEVMKKEKNIEDFI